MALEDFTTYTEVDPGADITVAANTLTMVACSDHSYVYKDAGAAHFGDYEHLLSTETGDGVVAACWMLSNGVGSLRQLYSAANAGHALYWRGTSTPNLRLRDLDDASQDTSTTLALNTEYWITVSRVTAALQAVIDSDAIGTNEDTIATTADATTLRYVYGYGSYGALGDLLVYDLDLQEAAAGVAPTGALYGSLIGPFGGPI